MSVTSPTGPLDQYLQHWPMGNHFSPHADRLSTPAEAVINANIGMPIQYERASRRSYDRRWASTSVRFGIMTGIVYCAGVPVPIIEQVG